MPRAAMKVLRQRLAPAHFNRAVTIAEPFSPDNAVEAGFSDRVVGASERQQVARNTTVALYTSFEGFRQLRRRFSQFVDTDDPRADLVHVLTVFRSFVLESPVLAQVMFSQPFA